MITPFRVARVSQAYLRKLAEPDVDFLMTWNRDKHPNLKHEDEITSPVKLKQNKFIGYVQKLFSTYDISVVPDPVLGIWQRSVEPSTLTTVDIEDPKLAEYIAAKIGRKFNQDAVLIFIDDPSGDDLKYVVRGVSDKWRVDLATLMKKNGLSGATFIGNRNTLILYARRDWGMVDSTESFISDLSGKFPQLMVDKVRGRFILVERSEYSDALQIAI